MQFGACVRLIATGSVLVFSSVCEVRADELRSFISPTGLDTFQLALRQSEQRSNTQLAADTISESFAKADRSDIDLIAITEQRDAGPTIDLAVDNSELPSVLVVSPSNISNPKVMRQTDRRVRREKSFARIVNLRLPPRTTSQHLESASDTDRKPLAQSALQPLLSNCGGMSPECLANKAWCGC
jgi:hypothetical protein